MKSFKTFRMSKTTTVDDNDGEEEDEEEVVDSSPSTTGSRLSVKYSSMGTLKVESGVPTKTSEVSET